MHLLAVVGMSEVQCKTLVAGVREPRHQWKVEVSSTNPVQKVILSNHFHPSWSIGAWRPAEIRSQRAQTAGAQNYRVGKK